MLATCVGLALANAIRAPATLAAAALALSAVLAAGVPRLRAPACALALVLGGWWWGSMRLDALERSLLAPEIGRSAAVTAVVVGPVRASTFALRIPAEVRRFDERSLRERVLLELPVGRSPPQGAILELRATVAAPRGPETASTSAAGWRAAASTSSCTAATGGSSAAAAGSAASPTGSALTSRRRSPLRSAGSDTPCSPGSSSARTRG